MWGLINEGFQFKKPFINEWSTKGSELKQMLIWTRIYLIQNSEEENAPSTKNKERDLIELQQLVNRSVDERTDLVIYTDSNCRAKGW